MVGAAALKATDLNITIMNMHDDKRYKNMLFYMEACDSGSMFEVGFDVNIGK